MIKGTDPKDFELISRAQAGDDTARAAMIDRHGALVTMIAARFGGGLDYRQEGTIGLIKAVDRFDLSRGLAFSTYALYYIYGQIKRATKHVDLIRRERDDRDSEDDDTRGLRMIDIVDLTPNAETTAVGDDIEDLVRRAIATLPERMRLVLTLYYYDDQTFTQIGEVLGVSRETARKIEREAVGIVGEIVRTAIEVGG